MEIKAILSTETGMYANMLDGYPFNLLANILICLQSSDKYIRECDVPTGVLYLSEKVLHYAMLI